MFSTIIILDFLVQLLFLFLRKCCLLGSEDLKLSDAIGIPMEDSTPAFLLNFELPLRALHLSFYC